MRGVAKEAALLAGAFLALSACSPAPSGPPGSAPVVDNGAGWRVGAETSRVTAELGPAGRPVVVAVCDPVIHVIRLELPTAPEDAFGPERAVLHADSLALPLEVRFRSPDDVAKSDPPAWIEVPVSITLITNLEAARDLRIERGDAAHTVIDLGFPTAPFRRVLDACR